MHQTANLTRPIIEALYHEALSLADEVRAVFAVGTLPPSDLNNADVRLALSTEGLKTTTRMMHILAWLLNQRAFFAGELSEGQVKLHGRLPADRPSDYEQLTLLEQPTRELIRDTEKMHARIMRLDISWRKQFEGGSPTHEMQDRIGQKYLNPEGMRKA